MIGTGRFLCGKCGKWITKTKKGVLRVHFGYIKEYPRLSLERSVPRIWRGAMTRHLLRASLFLAGALLGFTATKVATWATLQAARGIG